MFLKGCKKNLDKFAVINKKYNKNFINFSENGYRY